MAKIRRFYIDQKLEKNKPLNLPEKLKRHICNVLKLKNKSHIRLFGNDGREFAAILNIKKNSVYAIPLEEISKGSECSVKIILSQALPKLNKMDFIVQKSTEVGVERIIPFISTRTVFKGSNLESRMKRWRKIAEESARQCERTHVPIIENCENSVNLFKRNFDGMLKIILTPFGERKLKDLLREKINTDGILIVVGPEGGFEPSEIELAKKCGFVPVKLWENILRTETAGIIAAGIVRYEWGSESL